MSDNIPFEMQAEILKWLPVKSLILYRCVCKPWKSLIDSSRFIAQYHNINHTEETQHLLIRYEHEGTCLQQKHVLILDNADVDDDIFPQLKVFPNHLLVSTLKDSTIVGSSRGLLCLYRCYIEGRDVPIGIAVIWNPSVKKAIAVVVPKVGSNEYGTVLGFGVCRETNDPKIFKVTRVNSTGDIESISTIPWQVEVFALSTGVWRTSNSTYLPRKSIHFGSEKVVVDGVLYWLVGDGNMGYCNLIVSFDLASEEFKEVPLPRNLAHRFEVSISKLRESLVVVERVAINPAIVEPPVFSVWRMEGGVSKSFTKLYTFDVNKLYASVLGFRKSGEPIIEFSEDDRVRQLVVYEPYSKRITNFGIDGMQFPFYVTPYMETLLLLDKPNFSIYNGMETLVF